MGMLKLVVVRDVRRRRRGGWGLCDDALKEEKMKEKKQGKRREKAEKEGAVGSRLTSEVFGFFFLFGVMIKGLA